MLLRVGGIGMSSYGKIGSIEYRSPAAGDSYHTAVGYPP